MKNHFLSIVLSAFVLTLAFGSVALACGQDCSCSAPCGQTCACDKATDKACTCGSTCVCDPCDGKCASGMKAEARPQAKAADLILASVEIGSVPTVKALPMSSCSLMFSASSLVASQTTCASAAGCPQGAKCVPMSECKKQCAGQGCAGSCAGKPGCASAKTTGTSI